MKAKECFIESEKWKATWKESSQGCSFSHDGRIYFTEAMRQQAIRENKELQEIKTHEHKGCGEKSDAWIGALGEICFAWLLNLWGVSDMWERSEFATTKADPDFTQRQDGLTINVRTTRKANSLYVKYPKQVLKDKVEDVFVGFTTSWAEKGREEDMAFKRMATNGVRPYLQIVGFTTRGLMKEMIKNLHRSEIGDSQEPVWKGKGTLLQDINEPMFTKYMAARSATNRYQRTRIVFEGHSLSRWRLLKAFVSHNHEGEDKWARAQHLFTIA